MSNNTAYLPLQYLLSGPQKGRPDGSNISNANSY